MMADEFGTEIVYMLKISFCGIEQFAPENPSEVLITSADSQIRVFDGVDMIHKFRGKLITARSKYKKRHLRYQMGIL